MAKEINLSSREWCDLVFEGKNKDFGAYVIRTESSMRHNKAVFYTLIGALLLGAITAGFLKMNRYLDERRLAQMGEQQEVLIDMSQETEEPEPVQEHLEQEKPEELPENVLNTIKVTELAIVEDDQVKEEDEIKTVEEQLESLHSAGAVDFDMGTDNKLVTKEAKDNIIVEPPVEPEAKPEQIFQSVEQMPQFPGGEAALLKYLASHINYPPMAAENNIQGRVIVQFVVDKTGKVGEVKLVRTVDKDLDNEAVRVCKSLPRFTPGRQNGQPVSVWYTLPVTFKLQGAN